ncbi:hypothetical protein JCM19046_573 [Bacillus sp. JCM 19046]|uniref:Sigma-O factor regulatory protein RsoA n=1 Tax=Shouchella xiaoxiensis TaxID=766895 RepID=A0ABS2STX8_9BACI|nr:hypothetical protein [Shouchella xiaoxiensis]MBM7838715.1 hypothetical protein [Shouchella xiaoxiensis]GAF11866.1 hypothetical protein JCM19045_1005 [Bacillus sp. JCM 19045]GAF16160.1 hypothetical protein JCM19046_573 [Bacillus sp. JCM 19046]
MYEEYESILVDFNAKIKKSLYQTTPNNRDDLEQEIKIKLYEKLAVIQNIEAPGFYEFVYGSACVAEEEAVYRFQQKKE